MRNRLATTIPRAMNSCKRPSRFCWSGKSVADTWEALVRPGRKVPVGERIVFGDGELEALVEGRGEYGLRVLRFTSRSGFHEALGRLGHIPLPPYIKRADEPLDRERYQTVYAKRGSAVAAPTAGLHFTPEIIAELRRSGIEIAEITLDVGLGTFEPVRTEHLEDHADTRRSLRDSGRQRRPRSAEQNAESARCWRLGPRWCARWKMRPKKVREAKSRSRLGRPRRQYFFIQGSRFAW